MTHLLEKAGASFLRAFGAAIIVLAPGIWLAPDLNAAKALAISALFAGLTAGFKALQVFVPSLTFASILPQPYAAFADSFTRAFLGAFILSVIDITSHLGVAFQLGTLKALVTAALTGAIAAGFRALQGASTKGETPAPDKGV